ncbi:DUF4192 family protein [Demequina sp. NBRC 110057]|uniref:DUF4192 family protein n=1 Tax=Demequina sp. NBRC 110057 TaxID=1570346 RepID=UPI000A02EC4A|nr:DUF4192 family protein [Demequina sp. NBRC 110057]
METTTILGPGELIAALPDMLGYTPTEAVVVVALDRGGMVLCAAAVDSVDLAIPELAPSIGPILARDLAEAGTRRAIAVSWSDAAPGAVCPELEELAPDLRAVGIEPCLWATDGDRYWSPECHDDECCPVEGRPLPRGEWGSGGRAAARARHRSSRARPVASDAQRRSARRAADRWWRRRSEDREAWCLRAWDLTIGCGPDSDAPAWGKTIASLQDVRVRDALIVRWLGAEAAVVADVLTGTASEGVHRVMDGALRPGSATVPSAAQIGEGLRWCHEGATYARRTERAVLHALCAVLYWWADDLTASREAAADALDCDPSYSLALLVAQMCDRGLAPGWRRSPHTPPWGNG